MRQFLLLVITSLLPLKVFGQQLPLINSGALLETASVLEDSGKYELAIKDLLTIPKRDTNYLVTQTRIAKLYNYNKQYDEAIALADAILKKPGRYRSSVLATKAASLEAKKEYDQAIGLLQGALKDYPFDSQLRYQLATTYHNKLDYASAVKAYYEVLEISPFSSNVHLNLGAIALWTGQKTHALFSYGMYLALNNSDNSKLALLENVCSNQASNDGAAKDRAGVNAFEKLDQIIRSKIAMDKNFKTEVPIDVSIVKQFEMLAKQLNTVSKPTDDPWVKFYLPVFEALRDQKLMEPFLYHILKSSSIEAVKKWNAKNEKARETFFSLVNGTLGLARANVRVPESLGLGATTSAQYTDDNEVAGIGGFAENGKWIYYFTNSEKSAEGVYDNGVKKGVWNYYTDNGALNSTENEETGEVTKWNPDGGKEYSYFVKNDEIEGEIVFYYPCGTVSERRTHRAGKREGKAQLFHETGVKSAEFEYVNGKLEGMWTDYDVFGKVKGKTMYKDGQRDGLSETFWSSGKLKDRETYVGGKLSGVSEGHHDNGKLSYKGAYVNDEPVGEWLYYNRYDEQTERRFYATDGKIDQENIFYDDGKTYYKVVYDKGVTTQVVYYDKSGKETWKGGSPDGNFDVKHFYPNGQVVSEGKYKKGVRDGKWTQYFINGQLQASYNYLDGKYDGEQNDYFQNGKKKIISNFKAGKREGYYQELYITGRKLKEGWNSDDQAQQQWISYYPDGSISEDMYYINDKLTDSLFLHSVEGTIMVRNFNKDGEAVSESGGDPLQRTYTIDVKKSQAYDLKYANGSRATRYKTECGLLMGDFERFYPDGKPLNKFSYMAGTLHGPYEAYGVSGSTEASGAYGTGKPVGIWSYYNELNKPDQTFRYSNGEIDSTLVSYYEFGGVYFTAQYRKGDRHGVLKVLAPNGVPIVEKMYHEGQVAAVRTTNKSGELGEWLLMKPSMNIVAFYPGGTKAYEEKYENGLLSGVKRIWFPDGKLCQEYTYVDGDSEGPFADYYPSGKVCMKGQQHLDELDGTVEIFEENGMPRVTITYKMGRRSGTTTLYSKGVKTKEIVYYNGMPMK